MIGTIRCTSWPSALGAPGSIAAWSLIASSTVLASTSGADPSPSEYGTTIGRRTTVPPRSPRTIAASSLAGSSPRSWATPALPPLPPLVEASTIVRWVSREANTRASSSSAAVEDSSAFAGPRAASRWATITIGVSLVEPGRTATTLVSVRSPSIVWASKL